MVYFLSTGPDRPRDGVGPTNIILDHIEIARSAGLPLMFIYRLLGARQPQDGYKASSRELEVYMGGAAKDA